jgi:hypothetical protein
MIERQTALQQGLEIYQGRFIVEGNKAFVKEVNEAWVR